ncbi:sulfur reduction protein DsrE [Alteromonas sp. BL110]|uniref:DsrE family protein n=1 Tax=Alteromonas sp. BL110 TaxID=1714845 RepID=UPI000E489700|nr:DsrE family protein [Alteromonas sp. BL110]AXT40215.1 sulfur reduction protein DsrE [Alteromonas sp. BL110]RKM79447.1 sulfur reduction protein DsrE [Alteromonas sp. BL110]
MAHLLIRFTQSPFSSAKSQDGLDFALAATNYGHDVKVLFENQGVLQLVKAASTKGLKNHTKRLASMPFFDIEECYVCKMSAETYDIEHVLANTDLVEELECKWVTSSEKVALIQRVDHVVTF